MFQLGQTLWMSCHSCLKFCLISASVWPLLSAVTAVAGWLFRGLSSVSVFTTFKMPDSPSHCTCISGMFIIRFVQDRCISVVVISFNSKEFNHHSASYVYL
jgi:hypothetical protein